MTRWATGMRSRLRWQKWNPRSLAAVTSCTEKGSLGIFGTVLLIVLVLYLLGVLR
jgi:hypothetical protein